MPAYTRYKKYVHGLRFDQVDKWTKTRTKYFFVVYRGFSVPGKNDFCIKGEWSLVLGRSSVLAQAFQLTPVYFYRLSVLQRHLDPGIRIAFRGMVSVTCRANVLGMW